MRINVFDLAGYTSNLFEHEPLNLFGSIDTILSKKPENDGNNPILYEKPETPKPWVEYYRQLASNGELLTIDDLVFTDNWKEYHSWADEWDCTCTGNNQIGWCYCEDNKSSVKCSQW
jgi:hypothetical protein